MASNNSKVSDEDSIVIYKRARGIGCRKVSHEVLAQEYGVHKTTVSRAVKRGEEIYVDFARRVDEGKIRRPTEVAPVGDVASGEKPSTEVAVMQPAQFVQVLSDMNQMQQACQASGSFLATAAHTAIEGFRNEELPFDTRFQMVVTGSSALMGTLFSIYDGVRQLEKFRVTSKPPMREVDQDRGEQDE